MKKYNFLEFCVTEQAKWLAEKLFQKDGITHGGA
jgi:hypothetical protein